MTTHHWVYGLHAVTSLLKSSPEEVIALYVLKSRVNDVAADKLVSYAELLDLPIKYIAKEAFDQLLPKSNHQGFAAERFERKTLNENDLANLIKKLEVPPFFLVLDGVQDPHNLGACLRSADAAGVHAVIVPKDRSASLTATVSKVACGAAETVPLITVTNLSRTLEFLKENNIWCIGLDGEAKTSIYQFNLTGSLALVLGAEGKGLRRLTAEVCDALVSIPMCGNVASLNVSVATGVVLFEAMRQKKGGQ